MNARAKAVDEHARVRIDLSRAGEAVVVTVGGDVDLHSAPELREQLESASESEGDANLVVADLAEATFLDSMALGVLLAAKRNIEAHGKRLAIVAATAEVRRIFEITMLDRVFDLYPTRAEALVHPDGGGVAA